MPQDKRGETFVMGGDSGNEGAIGFTPFLLGLASSALIHLGVTPHPETNTTEVDLVLARQSMDLLSMLREKTRGNLTPEEERIFNELLTDLRLRYVEASRG